MHEKRNTPYTSDAKSELFASFLTTDNIHILIPAVKLYIIHDLTKGTAIGVIDGKEYTIDPGALLIYGPLAYCVNTYNEFLIDTDHEPFVWSR